MLITQTSSTKRFLVSATDSSELVRMNFMFQGYIRNQRICSSTFTGFHFAAPAFSTSNLNTSLQKLIREIDSNHPQFTLQELPNGIVSAQGSILASGAIYSKNIRIHKILAQALNQNLVNIYIISENTRLDGFSQYKVLKYPVEVHSSDWRITDCKPISPSFPKGVEAVICEGMGGVYKAASISPKTPAQCMLQAACTGVGQALQGFTIGPNGKIIPKCLQVNHCP